MPKIFATFDLGSDGICAKECQSIAEAEAIINSEKTYKGYVAVEPGGDSIPEIINRNIRAVLCTYDIKSMDKESLEFTLRQMIQSTLEDIARVIGK